MHEQFRKLYLICGFLGVLSLAGLVAVVLTTAPETGFGRNIFFFYALLLGTIFCFGAVIELAVRKRFAVGQFRSLFVSSLRQAALLGALVVVLLMLQASQLLFWWVGASLVLFFLSLEVFLSI